MPGSTDPHGTVHMVQLVSFRRTDVGLCNWKREREIERDGYSHAGGEVETSHQKHSVGMNCWGKINIVWQLHQYLDICDGKICNRMCIKHKMI